MSTTRLSCILEILGHPNGKDGNRKLETLNALRWATLHGHDVLFVVDTQVGEEPRDILHFGYNYRCEASCSHDPEPWGVKRYFGICLIVGGDWDLTSYPLDYLVTPRARLSVVIKGTPHLGERHALKPVEEI